VGALGESGGDLGGGDHRSYRIAIPHRLSQGDDVGHHVVGGEPPESGADPSEPGLHLIGDQ
jgi:hypothetical protein